MGKLHEVLASEKTRTAASEKILNETQQKFGKIEFFQGHVKTLKMIEETEGNKAVEAAASEERQLPTTVKETLAYALGLWSKAEDVIFQKNLTNQRAVADLMFRGNVVASGVPVDELLGLESRLEKLRSIMAQMPTLPAAIRVSPLSDSGREGAWMGLPETTVKTEKTTVPVVLYEATDKHPAQVKEVGQDKVVGKWELTKFYGMATSQQKADVISVLDDLIAEVKQARMRANSVDASVDTIGDKITALILAPFAG